MKMDLIATVIAEGLRHRGVPARAANYAARTAVTAFETAWTDWINNPHTEFSTLMQQATSDLRTVVCDSAPEPPRRSGINEHGTAGQSWITPERSRLEQTGQDP